MPDQTLPALIRADDGFTARKRRYSLNQAYYDGDHAIRTSRRRRGTVTTPRNLTRLFIDTTTDFIGSPTVTWGDQGVGPQLDEYLARVLDDNNAEIVDHATELSTAILGDGAQKTTWDIEQRRVRIVRVDPAGLYLHTNPADPDDVLIQAQQYQLSPFDFPVDLSGRPLASRSQKALVTEAWTPQTWEIWLDDELLDSQPNPYGGLMPYLVWPNTRRPSDAWGQGDGEPIKEMQDAYNEKTADLDRLIELASSIVVLSGVDGGDTAIAGLDYAVRPGQVWEIPADARAYLLELLTQSAVGQRLWDINALREVMHQIARVPVAALGDTGRDISGKALEIEVAPLLRLVARKRLTRTAAHRQRAIAIASLAAQFDGQPDHGDLRPDVTWSDPLPEDRAAEITLANALLALGASRATALSMAGIADPDDELAARRQEDRAINTPEEATTP